METKIQRRYLDYGFGFPVILYNVEMIKVRGQWVPHLNHRILAIEVLSRVAALKSRLTGNQVRFIRQYAEMPLQQFGKRLGVSHPAVIKWEKAANKPTGMNWSTEKDIRLFAIHQIEAPAEQFKALYLQLEEAAAKKPVKISLDIEKLAA